MARLRAAAALHSGHWLHSPPITAVSLRLSDEAIHVAVSYHLGCATCQPHFCVCFTMVNKKTGAHGLFCKKSAPRQIYHAQLNDIICLHGTLQSPTRMPFHMLMTQQQERRWPQTEQVQTRPSRTQSFPRPTISHHLQYRRMAHRMILPWSSSTSYRKGSQ